MTSNKVLVTGGAGYIGSHVALALYKEGYEPIIVDDLSKSDRTLLKGIEKIMQRSISFYHGSCLDQSFLDQIFQKEKNIMGVMHFAAYKSVYESVSSPLDYYHNNINALITLLKVVQTHGISPFVFSSSCTVYGQIEQLPVDEAAPFNKPSSPYGHTKQICEEILKNVVSVNKDLCVAALRYFNPIGAHPSACIGEVPIGVPNNLVPYITQTAVGIHPKLIVYGSDYDTSDGTCIRDFIHVVDLAKAHVKALTVMMEMKGNVFAPYNIGTGRGTSVLELIRSFEAVNNLKLPYEIAERRLGDVPAVYASIQKASRELGWVAQYTVEDALSHSWQWERKIRNL